MHAIFQVEKTTLFSHRGNFRQHMKFYYVFPTIMYFIKYLCLCMPFSFIVIANLVTCHRSEILLMFQISNTRLYKLLQMHAIFQVEKATLFFRCGNQSLPIEYISPPWKSLSHHLPFVVNEIRNLKHIRRVYIAI